jgi:energy-coupling factor transport system ATP-binding protein
MPYISVRDLHFSYPNYTQALQGVDLDIDLGEFIAIMGENGAGKTTLVKHFNGLLKAQTGNVIVDGADTRKVTVAQLSKNVGYVFQNPLYQLFSETVEKELELGLRSLNLSDQEKKDRIDEVLIALGIERFRDRHPLMLSEGERKSVAIASVLVMDPKVLIVDEPTLALDLLEKKRLSNVLTRLHGEGRSVILVTHDVDFAFDHSERVVTMSRGKILADGPKEEVVNDKTLFEKAGLVEPQLYQLLKHFELSGVHTSDFSVKSVFQDIVEHTKKGDG